MYGADFKEGKGYSALKPAYSLVFVDFPLFKHFHGENAFVGPGLAKNFEQRAGRDHVSSPDTKVLHSFSIREDLPPHFVLTNHLSITIADLSRVPGDLKNIVDMVSAWCYFSTKEGVPSRLGTKLQSIAQCPTLCPRRHGGQDV